MQSHDKQANDRLNPNYDFQSTDGFYWNFTSNFDHEESELFSRKGRFWLN